MTAPSCLQCGHVDTRDAPCSRCGHVHTDEESARSNALVRAVKRLPGEASPTAISILQEQLLQEERSKLRVDDRHMVVDRGNARAMVGLLGGSLLASISIGVKEQTLNHHIQRGRMPRTVYKRLKMAAINRFTEILKESPR